MYVWANAEMPRATAKPTTSSAARMRVLRSPVKVMELPSRTGSRPTSTAIWARKAEPMPKRAAPSMEARPIVSIFQ